jgi:hypothetical protein
VGSQEAASRQQAATIRTSLSEDSQLGASLGVPYLPGELRVRRVQKIRCLSAVSPCLMH